VPVSRRRRRKTTTAEPVPEEPTLPSTTAAEETAPARALTLAGVESLERSLPPAAKVIRDAVSRDLEERGVPPMDDDVVLNTLQKVVDGIRSGTDISGVQAEVTRLVTNHESRSELIDNLMLAHDYDRLVKYARARARVENLLIRATERDDLTPTEALAFMAIIVQEAKTIQGRIKAGATDVKDVLALLERADYTVTVAQADLAKKFASTTPQGREIVRRLAHKLSRIKGVEKASTPADRAEIRE
jgi:DNA-binding MarR family transcriptional regulator